MTSHALGRSYSIKEAAALTGLPASTLRYYERVLASDVRYRFVIDTSTLA